MEAGKFTGMSVGRPIEPGTLLNDAFEIGEKIATGGMGEVFRGRNITSGEVVAIKIVLHEYADDEKYTSLFFKEASVLRSLNHPSIVRYQTFMKDKAIDRPYMVMEYVEGISLAERLKSGPLSVTEVRRLTAKLAEGLDVAHAAGVVHRDLSPDNILLPDGDIARPKLIDFGIARSTQAGHKTLLAGDFAGRTNFASPEQFGHFSKQVLASSDVYSLGLVVINMLQGEPLDMSGSVVEMIEKRSRIPDLSNLDPGVRPIIEQMLVPNPADRHLTMADLADYFSERKSWVTLERSATTSDTEDFWQPTPAGVLPSISTPEELQGKGATIALPLRDEAAAAPKSAQTQLAAASSGGFATALSPSQYPQPAIEPTMIQAAPIAWETQPVLETLPVAARSRGRRAWSYTAAAVLILAAGGAGAVYSGALKSILPPDLEASLLGRPASVQTAGQTVQDELPALATQPKIEKPAVKKETVAVDDLASPKTQVQNDAVATPKLPVKSQTEGVIEKRNAARDAQIAADDGAWKAAKGQNDRPGYSNYLQAYPQGRHSEAARQALADMDRQEALAAADDQAWERARAESSKLGYSAYLGTYAHGRHSDSAKKALADIELQEAIAIADDRAWEIAAQQKSRAGFDTYIETYPTGRHFDAAQKALADLDAAEARQADDHAWETAAGQDSKAGYDAYIQAYPSGHHIGEAQIALTIIETEAAAVAAEDQAWKRARRLNSRLGYNAYLSAYPSGRYIFAVRGALADIETAEEAAAADDRAWDEAEKQNSKAGYSSYADAYPSGRHLDDARKALDAIDVAEAGDALDKEAWEHATEVNSIAEYDAYLKSYPAGHHAEDALEALNEIKSNAALEAAHESQYGGVLTPFVPQKSTSGRIHKNAIKKVVKKKSSVTRVVLDEFGCEPGKPFPTRRAPNCGGLAK